jgi:hypothetical protein
MLISRAARWDMRREGLLLLFTVNVAIPCFVMPGSQIGLEFSVSNI